MWQLEDDISLHYNDDLVMSHVIPAMIRKFKEAKEQNLPTVILWGDGSPMWEFLYVEDAAEGLVLATERFDKPESVNLGSGAEISIKDLADLIKRLTGYQGAIIWDTTKPNGQPRRLLDVSRAEREFGFQARINLTAGLSHSPLCVRLGRRPCVPVELRC